MITAKWNTNNQSLTYGQGDEPSTSQTFAFVFYIC